MSAEAVVLNSDFFQYAHEHYARLRSAGPAQRVVSADGMPLFLITRYEEAKSALADPRFRKDYRGIFEAMRAKSPEARFGENSDALAHMLNMDPPDHTRLRKLVMKAFTLRRIEQLRPRVEEITQELLAEMAEKSEVDLLSAFAFPLPIKVISDLLGVPQERQGDFREWTTILLGGDRDAAREASYHLTEYLAELVSVKRADPADDLISALIEARDEADRLSEPELIAMLFLLLIAGHETTVNLIGNCVLSLLDQGGFDARPLDQEWVNGAVEETLRFESPVGLATTRYTSEPVRMGEVDIPANELVLVGIGSANRDERRFADADEFDPARSAAGHLGFGHGIHFCLGASLARLEAQVAVARLVERFPRMRLACERDELRWRFSTIVHGVETLPVRLG